MANHDTIVEREYFDEITKQNIKINLKVIDALYLDFIKRIEMAIRSLRKNG